MKITKITAKQKRDYLDEPNVCPHCNSINISGDEVNVDYGIAWQIVGCAECGESWKDTYKLINVEAI
jgi:transcription elongation factor Elf1